MEERTRPWQDLQLEALLSSVLLTMLQRFLRFKIVFGERPRGVGCRVLIRGMERFEKANERRNLRGREILTVGRHISTTLNYLPDQLIFRQSRCYSIEGWTTLPTDSSKCMTVPALLYLKDIGPLTEKRSG